MKKIHIIGIVIIAIALAAIVSTISSSSTYASFRTADEHPGSVYHVVGKLDTTQSQVYDPAVNANIFTFYLTDMEGNNKKVVYNNTRPQDFEKAEQIVIVGKSSGDEFHAAEILMKCPSKYNGNQGQKNQLNSNS
jgi:cytochrome c-type biogenesis protein CcmE